MSYDYHKSILENYKTLRSYIWSKHSFLKDEIIGNVPNTYLSGLEEMARVGIVHVKDHVLVFDLVFIDWKNSHKSVCEAITGFFKRCLKTRVMGVEDLFEEVDLPYIEKQRSEEPSSPNPDSFSRTPEPEEPVSNMETAKVVDQVDEIASPYNPLYDPLIWKSLEFIESLRNVSCTGLEDVGLYRPTVSYNNISSGRCYWR